MAPKTEKKDADGLDEKIRAMAAQIKTLSTDLVTLRKSAATSADEAKRGLKALTERVEVLETTGHGGLPYAFYRLPDGDAPAIVEDVRPDGTIDLVWFRDGRATGVTRVVVSSAEEAALGQAFRR